MKSPLRFPTHWRIVFTGRLASMSRIAALRSVAGFGGLVRSRVTRRTNVLVIGSDGWPLRKTGVITRNLQRASDLQESGCEVSIIDEAEFLRRLCESSDLLPIRQEHSLEQLSRLLGISGLRLRRWVALELIRPANDTLISPTFDYQQVARARSLAQLITRGVSPNTLAKSLRKLQRWLPDDRSLGVGIIALENQLLIRRGEELIDASGQLHFSFDEQAGQPAVSAPATVADTEDPDSLFDRAYQYERSGRKDDAMQVYVDWLKCFGEDHEVLFNLANIYFNNGMFEQAINIYRSCLRVEPTYASAWNNLGLCLHRAGDLAMAIDALRRSVDFDPDNIETLFNLADMLDEVGSDWEVRLLWLRIARQGGNLNNDVERFARDRLVGGFCNESNI